MPFGLIFSIVLFIVLAIAFLAGLPSLAGWLRLLELLIGGLLATVAAGLLMRQPWSRWIGAASGLLLAWVGFGLAVSRGTVMDILVLLAGVLLTVMLVVPATGNVRRGLAVDEVRRSIPGRVLGVIGALLLVWAVAVFSMVVIRQPQAPPRQSVPGEPGLSQVAWNDFATGLELAEAEGKPILVEFYTVWCGFCKRMDQTTFRDSRVVASLQGVIPVKVDAEGTQTVRGFTGEELAEKYQAFTYPTLVLLDARGRVISRSRGGMPTDRFLVWLEEALARRGRPVKPKVPGEPGEPVPREPTLGEQAVAEWKAVLQRDPTREDARMYIRLIL